MRSQSLFVVVVASAVTAGALLGASFGRSAEEADVVLSAKDVPAAVRQTADHFSEAMPLVRAVLADEDGLRVYELTYQKGPRALTVQTTADGALFATEESVSDGDVPALVKQRAATLFPRGERVQFERTVTVTYEVAGRGSDGKEVEFLVNPAGAAFREVAGGVRENEH